MAAFAGLATDAWEMARVSAVSSGIVILRIEVAPWETLQIAIKVMSEQAVGKRHCRKYTLQKQYVFQSIIDV
jgi:hypothetical protein